MKAEKTRNPTIFRWVSFVKQDNFLLFCEKYRINCVV